MARMVFTMELVKGVNFLEYVRPGYQSRHRQSSKTPTLLKGTQEGSPPNYWRLRSRDAPVGYDQFFRLR